MTLEYSQLFLDGMMLGVFWLFLLGAVTLPLYGLNKWLNWF